MHNDLNIDLNEIPYIEPRKDRINDLRSAYEYGKQEVYQEILNLWNNHEYPEYLECDLYEYLKRKELL